MNRSWVGRWLLVLLGLIVNGGEIQAQQTNSWNSSTSGNWEDSSWSLGVPPGAGQKVFVSNHGWKAVAIGAGTAGNFPQTLSIDALTLISPGTDTVNSVLLNYAGLQTPLAISHDLYVSNDTSLVVLQSAINVTNGFTVGGTVTHDVSSQVTAFNLSVTDAGAYNLLDGSLTVLQAGQENILSGGQFHQSGGSNFCARLAISGEYDFSGGQLVLPQSQWVTQGIQDFGNFVQSAGTLDGPITVGMAGGNSAYFHLGGGSVHAAWLQLPASGSGYIGDNSFFTQTGGTNVVGAVNIGAVSVQLDNPSPGFGTYSLSNGLLVSTNIAINGRGSFNQFGGVHTNASLDLTETIFFIQQQPGSPSYWTSQLGTYRLMGGTFVSDSVNGAPGAFDQSDGIAQITTLQMAGGQYNLSGGQLIATDINLTGGGMLIQTGGTITQSGTFALGGGGFTAGPGSQQLGKLLLSEGVSALTLPAANCTLRFADSSSLVWSNGSVLNINNWRGSLAGGGFQQIFFGNNASGLTAQQLSQLQFNNPAGLSVGYYPARLLSNGELVPDANQGEGSPPSENVNSWVSQTGGNWDDAFSWSLGVPPGSSQDIFFTNAYWKAITIDSSTVSSAPETLAVKSLTVTSVSPTNGSYTTKNTLLLNYAQPGNPLVIGVDTNNPGSLLVDHDSTLAMFYSGLIVNDALGETNSRLGEFQVDGNFIQSDNSEVVAGFLDLNGTYNMTNGQLFVGTQFINGTFNQQGGTNTGSIVSGTNGNYQLFDGAFNGDITLYPGHFTQWGGQVSAQLAFYEPASAGVYLLEGGILLPGDLDLGSKPVSNYNVFPAGVFEQSGGTNNPTSLTIGFGTYYLTNGVVNASSITLTTNMWAGNLDAGDFEQYGGYVTNSALTLNGGTNTTQKQILISPAKYNLYNGILDTPSLTMNVADFSLSTFYFHATNRVGTLSMNASIYQMNLEGYLQVDQLQVTNGSQFWHQGGVLSGARNLTLANGEWAESTAATQLGQLHLLTGTNSSIYLPNTGVLQFADSSIVPWASGGILTIGNWKGSFSGGGAQQILFGASASGLTAQQLSQVQFLNPASLPNGIYGAKILSTGELVPDGNASTTGPVNFWINPGSGNWDDASSWSLDALPNGSQSVLIVNTNWKAVAINPSTPVNFPASMTVSNLFIEGSTNTQNTLLLNNFGTNVPLTVRNGLLLQDNAQIINFNSGLVIQGATEISNSIVIQDGGVIRNTNGMTVSGSQLHITNGVFDAASVALGFPVASRLYQYGGSVEIDSVALGTYASGGTNVNGISLYGGTLDLPGGMYMLGERFGLSYFQEGGTNRTGQITIEADYGGANPDFTLNGGLLADTSVLAYGGPTINQNGGTHVVTNSLSLAGESVHGLTPLPSTYNLNGGTLSAASVILNAENGPGVFNQSNGVAYVGELDGSSQPYASYWSAALTLSGGTLVCSNLDMLDSGTITQTGGALVVSNTLTVAGFIAPGPKIYSKYYFTDGTLTASNINIGGNWFIGDSAGTNRITNPGTCTLSNSISIGNAVEQLGQFILGGPATIDLSGSSSRLSFVNSSGQTWTSAGPLVILDWNGNASGGGAEQLKFGTDQSGLTAAQLNEIQFRISTNLYSAKILNTGEVVPDQIIASPLTYTQQGNQLTLSWPSGYKLQSATSPTGPFQNVQDPFPPNPPYTVNMNQPQQFYRIVPQ